MRKINSFIEGKLDQDDFSTYSLIEVELSSTTLRLTDQQFNIQVDGEAEIYLADSGIIQFDPPRQSSTVDRESFTLVLSDTSGAFKTEFEKNIAGNNVRIRTGFMNNDGTPNTVADNLITTYSGYVDSSAYNNDFGAASVSIECSSPMQDLGLVKTIITSANGMDQFNLTDTSFDNVIEDNETSANWGKE